MSHSPTANENVKPPVPAYSAKGSLIGRLGLIVFFAGALLVSAEDLPDFRPASTETQAEIDDVKCPKGTKPMGVDCVYREQWSDNEWRDYHRCVGVGPQGQRLVLQPTVIGDGGQPLHIIAEKKELDCDGIAP